MTDRRTALDFAHLLRWLADDLPVAARKVVLVMDNLNTHKMASLYQAFPPAEGRRRAERFAIPHPPKHGSGLNMAEIELSALSEAGLWNIALTPTAQYGGDRVERPQQPVLGPTAGRPSDVGAGGSGVADRPR